MPIDLRASRRMVEESILMAVILIVSPATPKPDLAVSESDFLLVYFPYAPRESRVSEVAIRVTRRSLRISLVNKSAETTIGGAKNGSAWRVDR